MKAERSPEKGISIEETVERLKAEKEFYTDTILKKAEEMGFNWAKNASYEDLLKMEPSNTEDDYSLPSRSRRASR